ncbi:MAG: hypothetical protein ABIK82_17390 [Pseudomonadota bacterium]
MGLSDIALSPTTLWLLGVAVVLLGWVVRHWLANSRTKHSNSQSAAVKFREAFLPELAVLESRAGTEQSTRDFLLAAFDRHQMAVTSYQGFLVGQMLRDFRSAWKNYHYGQDFDPAKFGLCGKDSVLLQYIAISDEEEFAAKQLAITNIHGLLSFADHL